jgi:sugar-phosphatase
VEIDCQALLFDLDGVLVDSRSVVERTWRRWADRHHMDAGAVLAVAHGRRTRDTVQDVAPHLDVDAEVAWLEGAEVADLDGLVAVPGAMALLLGLRMGSWAVVTSGGLTLARRRLEAVGLPIPPVLVTSDDVTSGKPAPDGYRLAARRLGYDPASCLAFEDTPPGIAAAGGAGARVVALSTTHPAFRLAEADAVTPDFTAISVRATTAGLVVWIEGV